MPNQLELCTQTHLKTFREISFVNTFISTAPAPPLSRLVLLESFQAKKKSTILRNCDTMSKPDEMSTSVEAVRQKFVKEEKARKEMLDKRIEEKRKRLNQLGNDDATRLKTRCEAEYIRKKADRDREAEAEIAALWKAYEAKVKELEAKLQAEIAKLTAAKEEEMKTRLNETRKLFQKQIENRRNQMENEIERYKKVMERGDFTSDVDRRAFLKKELVKFKDFSETRKIPDEDALRRLQCSITKNAIHVTSTSIMYRGTFQGTNCAVKIVVLSDRSPKYRQDLPRTSKVARYLMSGGEGGGSQGGHFPRMYDFFYTESKSYGFFEELQLESMGERARKQKLARADFVKALGEVCQALAYMHTRAVAHLNVRADCILFDAHNGAAKLGGLLYSAIYFDIETETSFKLPKMDKPYRHSYPQEVYVDKFEPQPADVYSIGYLVFRVLCDIHKVKLSSHKLNLDLITDAPAKAFIVAATPAEAKDRPTFKQLLGHEFIAAAH